MQITKSDNYDYFKAGDQPPDAAWLDFTPVAMQHDCQSNYVRSGHQIVRNIVDIRCFDLCQLTHYELGSGPIARRILPARHSGHVRSGRIGPLDGHSSYAGQCSGTKSLPDSYKFTSTAARLSLYTFSILTMTPLYCLWRFGKTAWNNNFRP